MTPSIERREVRLHGHPVRYRIAGEGPPLLLVHGIAGSGLTWEDVMPALAERNTVIAPDMLGHGESAKPRGDYSLGAYASGLRDLLAVLGHDRATIVGHSLGGGVAMVFAYQFPERTERLVLVDSGGLGKEVSFVIRAASLPGSEIVLPLLSSTPVLRAGGALAGALGKLGLKIGPDMQEVGRSFESFGDLRTRTAFIHTVRAVIDPDGQRVSARDRLYLAEGVPTLIVWGERDPIIPIAHGRAAHTLIPGSHFVAFENAGHFPHRDDPARFVRVLQGFLDETEPAFLEDERTRELLRNGGDAS
jgi:pimeloyl-ACP methyl ester carboxylesterase